MSDVTHRAVKRSADDEDNRDVVAVKRRWSPANVQRDTGIMNAGAARIPCRSAFQPVDKASLGPTTPPSPSPAISSSSPSDVAGIASLLPLSVATSAALKALDVAPTARHAGTATSELLVFPAAIPTERLRPPLILGAGFVAPNNPAPDTFYPKIGDESAYARNFVANNNNNAAAGNDVKLFNRSSLGVAVDQSRHAPLPSPPPLPLLANGGYRTANPMMEKLLQLVSSPRPATVSKSGGGGGCATLSASLPSLHLVQNWCAKCNTSFRMTSDLVYHMRTQHKRDLDPASQGRRKDANKLRCDVCGETFKERHHLTRHMTSHT